MFIERIGYVCDCEASRDGTTEVLDRSVRKTLFDGSQGLRTLGPSISNLLVRALEIREASD